MGVHIVRHDGAVMSVAILAQVISRATKGLLHGSGAVCVTSLRLFRAMASPEQMGALLQQIANLTAALQNQQQQVPQAPGLGGHSSRKLIDVKQLKIPSFDDGEVVSLTIGLSRSNVQSDR